MALGAGCGTRVRKRRHRSELAGKGLGRVLINAQIGGPLSGVIRTLRPPRTTRSRWPRTTRSRWLLIRSSIVMTLFSGLGVSLTWRLPLAGVVAFSHLQFSQIRGRQPYLIVRKILYVIHPNGWVGAPRGRLQPSRLRLDRDVTAMRVVVGHCPRDQVPDFTARSVHVGRVNSSNK